MAGMRFVNLKLHRGSCTFSQQMANNWRVLIAANLLERSAQCTGLCKPRWAHTYVHGPQRSGDVCRHPHYMVAGTVPRDDAPRTKCSQDSRRCACPARQYHLAFPLCRWRELHGATRSPPEPSGHRVWKGYRDQLHVWAHDMHVPGCVSPNAK